MHGPCQASAPGKRRAGRAQRWPQRSASRARWGRCSASVQARTRGSQTELAGRSCIHHRARPGRRLGRPLLSLTAAPRLAATARRRGAHGCQSSPDRTAAPSRAPLRASHNEASGPERSSQWRGQSHGRGQVSRSTSGSRRNDLGLGQHGGRAAQPALAGTDAALTALAVPDEWRRVSIPARHRVLQPADHLLGTVRVLPG